MRNEDWLPVGTVVRVIDFRNDTSELDILREDGERIELIGEQTAVRGYHTRPTNDPYRDWCIYLQAGPRSYTWPRKWLVVTSTGLKDLATRYHGR